MAAPIHYFGRREYPTEAMTPATVPQPVFPPAAGVLHRLARHGCVRKTVTLCTFLAAASAAQADDPLRYRFEAGRQLVYECRETVIPLDRNEPLHRAVNQVQIWCLERRAGEMFILFDQQRVEDGRTEPVAGALLYCDEAGRRRLPEETPSRLDTLDWALTLLPMLPLGAEGDSVWATPPDHFNRQWRCTSRGPDPACEGHLRIEFTLEEPLGLANLLGQSRSGQFWFDPDDGHVSRFEAEELDLRTRTRTRATAVLRQKATQTSAWAARRSEESDRFRRALRNEDRLLAEVVTRPDELARTLAQLDKLWSAFKSDVEPRTGSPFLELADGRRQQLRDDAGLFQTRASLGLRWMNQPARPWSLQDPAGRTVTSEATRPGVAIECFWSFDSVPGLRALESVRRLQAALGPNPPRVICYNMDNDVDFARRAIERGGRGLTHILAGPLQDAEALPEFPVVRVVDRQGIIRGIWIGWQPDYPAARELARRLANP